MLEYVTMSEPLREMPQDGVIIPHPTGLRTRDALWAVPLAAVATSRIGVLIDESLDVRGLLPDPVDIPNHVGNLAVTFALLHTVAKRAWGDGITPATPEEYKKRRRVIGFAVGALTIAANVFAEKIGYGPGSTPDPLDFVYGCLGGFLAYQTTKPAYLNPDVVALVRNDDNPTSSAKAVLDNVFEKRALENSKPTTPKTTTPRSPKTTSGSKGNSKQTQRNKTKVQRQSRKNNRKKSR